MKKQEFDKMMKNSFGERVENISSKPNRTVTVSTRAVYHRYGEVTIDIPDNVKSEEIVNWLNDNEYLYEEDIDQRLYECKPELGFGCREGMCEKNAVVETRYDVYCKSQYLEGGHL
jgi:hypothetical protein|tara:strand:+ start:208 stop:555 length:348 start_codon:yes stop_codon:yes gene_type:complete